MPSLSRRWPVSLPILAAVVVALACGGGDSTSPSLDAGVVDTANIKLNYMCGNTFRARNYNTASVSVTWDVVGTTEQGTLVLPPRPTGEGFSATLFTPQHVGTVRLLYQGQVLQSKENEGGPPCPAEPVGLQPPDSIPAWVYADSNISDGSQFISGRFVKHIVTMSFQPGIPAAIRQQLIDSVHARVVGGRLFPGAEGEYYLEVPDSGDGAGIVEAARALTAMPEVVEATPEIFLDPNFLRPQDGPRWTSWRLDADSADGENWGQELLDMPYAWGCETGSASAPIALVDVGFQSITESNGNIDPRFLPSYVPYDPSKRNDHGTNVLAVMAARGNDSLGMAGAMWHAAVRVYEPSGSSPQAFLLSVIEQMYLAARDGAKVVNVSQGILWNGHIPSGSADSIRIASAREKFLSNVSRLQSVGIDIPLYIFSAGNDGLPARDNGMAAAAEGPDSVNMLVVGAITPGRGRWTSQFNSSNTGPLVGLAAPGAAIATWRGFGQIDTVSGTSIAAPFVTGIAGLLLSFDPRLSGGELRQLILEGARRGGHFATGFTQPVLIPNAYESLRTAAERPGAPLCGNRVWAAGGAVYADRGGSPEQLFQLGEPGGYLDVYHGGRRIDVDVAHGFGRTFTLSGGNWSEVADPSTLPSGVPSGAFNSLIGFSHDRDTLLVPFPSGTSNSFSLGLSIRTVQQPDPPQSLGTVTVPVAPSAMMWECRWREAQVRSQDGQAVFDHWFCVDSVATGSQEHAGPVFAYSPAGDRVILAFNRRLTISSVTGSFAACPWSRQGSNYNTDECLASYTITEQTERSDILEFDIRTGNPRSLFTMAGREVLALSIGESGTEGTFDTGVSNSSVTAVPSDSLQGWEVESPTPQNPACQVEFREIDTGLPTRPAISSADPCTSFFLVGGTLAPLRAASPGSVSTRQPRTSVIQGR